jgi:probable F420-dependent oxidoreductase
MKFIYQYPELTGTDGDMLDAGPVAKVATIAEDAGWDGFAFTEHPAPGSRWLENGGHQSLDPFIALGHAAAVTERMLLLTYLSVAAYRNPLLLAKSATTVDRLSGGRFVLGLGAGYQKSEFFALGAGFDERGPLLDEALEVLPLHWSGEPFSYTGRNFNARDVIARPAPLNKSIPIWIGGNADAALRRVATRAQGWMPLVGGAELFQTTKAPGISSVADLGAKITELRERAGAKADSIDVVISYHDIAAAELTKDAARHQDSFSQLAEVGVGYIVVNTPTPDLASTTEFTQGFIETYAGK